MTGNRSSDQGGKIVVRIDPDLKDLIPGFLENRRKDLRTMVEALERGDHEDIRRFAHTIKGVGGGYGFDAITEICRRIHEAAGRRDDAEIRRCVTELSGYLDRVEVVFE